MPHATQVRPRYPRIAAAGSAFVITVVTLLGGVGVLPSGSPAAAETARSGNRVALTTLTVPDATGSPDPASNEMSSRPAIQGQSPTPTLAEQDTDDSALPGGSGSGRRVVFDISDQRVWLVDNSDEVRRTYLVSGSLTDNLDPGTYAVYSRSRHAVGIDDSGVMEYFTRFTRGVNAAIGFHSIPTKNGKPLQTEKQLGTPQSHGCIRQARPDAKRLWAFAPVGTKVVVTA